jgi:hypothetical protein
VRRLASAAAVLCQLCGTSASARNLGFEWLIRPTRRAFPTGRAHAAIDPAACLREHDTVKSAALLAAIDGCAWHQHYHPGDGRIRRGPERESALEQLRLADAAQRPHAGGGVGWRAALCCITRPPRAAGAEHDQQERDSNPQSAVSPHP